MDEVMLKNLQKVAEHEIKPSALSCDYEAVVIQTVEKIFPSTKCFQSVKRLLVRDFTKISTSSKKFGTS